MYIGPAVKRGLAALLALDLAFASFPASSLAFAKEGTSSSEDAQLALLADEDETESGADAFTPSNDEADNQGNQEAYTDDGSDVQAEPGEDPDSGEPADSADDETDADGAQEADPDETATDDSSDAGETDEAADAEAPATDDTKPADESATPDPTATDAKKDPSATSKESEDAEVSLLQYNKSNPAMQEVAVTYQGHVQNIGWQNAVKSGQVCGTSGRALRVEAVKINLPKGTKGGVTYRGHVQNIGWMDWVSDGAVCGTTGRALRVEAFQIKLTGDIAKTHDIWYRGHVQNIGWMDWVSNGKICGTTGRALRAEAIQILVLPKGATAPANDGDVIGEDGTTEASITYRASATTLGWRGWMRDGETAGTTGGITMNGMQATLGGLPANQLSYSAHIANVGWVNPVSGNTTIGSAKSKNGIEAITMSLKGAAAKQYDIYYHVYTPGRGWMAWSKNGAKNGTQGFGTAISAYEAILVAKGDAAPSSSGCASKAFIDKPSLNIRAHVQNIGWQRWVGDGSTAGTTGRGLRVEAFQVKVSSSITGDIQMMSHVQNVGWQNWISSGKTSGTTGRALRVEAVKIRLTGQLAKEYDIYYRVHAEKLGWLGWAKNGASAGTQGFAFRLEALQVKIVAKNSAAPGSTSGAFYDAANGTKYGWQNPAGYYQVSAKNVTITSAARAPWNYVTPSRIGLYASRETCVNTFLQRAREYVGSPYVWNYSCSPDVGVDCIGLVYQCAYACGMDLGGGTGRYDFNPWAHYITGDNGWHSHDANNFWNDGRTLHVPVSERQPGDILYWPGHVAIYMGGDTLIEAYTPSTGVIYSNLNFRSYPTGCMRLFI